MHVSHASIGTPMAMPARPARPFVARLKPSAHATIAMSMAATLAAIVQDGQGALR